MTESKENELERVPKPSTSATASPPKLRTIIAMEHPIAENPMNDFTDAGTLEPQELSGTDFWRDDIPNYEQWQLAELDHAIYINPDAFFEAIGPYEEHPDMGQRLQITMTANKMISLMETDYNGIKNMHGMWIAFNEMLHEMENDPIPSGQFFDE